MTVGCVYGIEIHKINRYKMKHALLALLLGAGLIFGNVAAPAAAQPVDSTELAALIETPTEIRTDSLLQALDARMTALEGAIEGVNRSSDTPFDFNGDHLMVVLIVLISTGSGVAMVFFIMRFWYIALKKKYEAQRYAIEHGHSPSEFETMGRPLTSFIRRLLIVAIVGFVILVWIGLLNLSYMRFFTSLLLWGLILGVGYAIVYLFRQYVQRRDENR